jgi:hypothetical protein
MHQRALAFCNFISFRAGEVRSCCRGSVGSGERYAEGSGG